MFSVVCYSSYVKALIDSPDNILQFHQNFHVKSPSSAEKPFHSALASALEVQGGSPEEVIQSFLMTLVWLI